MSKLDLIILLGSTVAFCIAGGYVLLALKSSQALNELQRSKLIELEKSEQKLRSIFEHSLAGMFKFNFNSFEVVDTNYTLRTMLSWKSLDDYKILSYSISKKDLDAISSVITQRGRVVDYEINCTSLKGEKFWGLLSAERIGDEEFAHGVLIDISKRKLFEEKNEEQAALLNETQDAIIVLDEFGNIAFWNSSAEFIYGFTKESVLGHPLKSLLFDNGNASEYEHVWTDVSNYKEWSGTQRQYKADGTDILVDSNWKRISSKATERDIILIVNTDITEKKKMEDMFLRSQKMETLALLTSSIAHDLQNILAPVSMSIGLLKDDVKHPKSLQILNAVEESANSGVQLLKKILTIGKGIKGEIEIVDINTLLDVLIDSFTVGLPETFQLKRKYRQSNFTVMGDQNQLHQVFLNLLVNARDAMPNGGTITISAHDLDKNDFMVQEFTSKPSSSYGVFSVSDTGSGIKESDFEKIFDPFFTTKQPDVGSGLGLSIVQNIVKLHEGFLEVDSTVGKGSTFKIYLPLYIPI